MRIKYTDVNGKVLEWFGMTVLVAYSFGFKRYLELICSMGAMAIVFSVIATFVANLVLNHKE